jgi:hypothetical protein
MDGLSLFGEWKYHCRRRVVLLLYLVFIAVALFGGTGHAIMLTFTWDAEDGAAGYKLYYGLASHTYSTCIDVGNVIQYSLNIAGGRAYYFALTAYDSARLESDYSNEVIYGAEPCSYSISPGSASVDAGGGSGTVEVSAPGKCSWSAWSGASWIRIASGNTGKGTRKVTYSAEANAGGPRTAVSTIAEQLFTLNQDGRTFLITSSPGANGSISPAGKISVPFGSDQSFAIIPDAGYKIKNVIVDGRVVEEVGSYMFAGVSSNHSIRAVFAPVVHLLTITTTGSGKGRVLRRPMGTVFRAGSIVTITAQPSFDSFFTGWSGACSGADPVCRVTMANDISVDAQFGRKYSVTASHDPHGSISPAGRVNVREGETLPFTITAKSGYRVRDVIVDGTSVGPTGSYTFTAVAANHTIVARFGK